MPDPAYSLTDLADLAGVTPRTVRYYVAQGLLSSPGLGPGVRYGEGHLARLRLIKQLQRAHLPLAEIRSRLAGLSDDEVAALASGPPAPTGTALDYVRGVLGSVAPAALPASPAPTAHASAALYRRAEPALPDQPGPWPVEFPRDRSSLERRLLVGTIGPLEPIRSAEPERSQWDRIRLSPDVELHVRRPLDRLTNRRVERLLALAHDLFEEDQP
ncbi:MAG TPA: MerR family transcriptional regulator [Candidatus Limnocylindrales bacterium]